MSKNKTAIAFASFLMFAMTFSLVALPAANAHEPAWQIPTLAFCNVAPNPVGVGQQVTIGFWLMEPPPTESPGYGDRWTGMTVKVTKPDGTTKTLGPFTSDLTGGTWAPYTPDVTGNYTFQMSFPGQTLEGSNPPAAGFGVATPYIGDYYKPSVSNIATLTVQEESVPLIPADPLPPSYWTRPINAMNNNWYSIGGNWLGIGGEGTYNASTNFNPWSTAPLSSHILWTKPDGFGGTVGGEFGGDLTSNFYAARQYERMFLPIILSGVLYYNLYPVGGDRKPFSATAASTPSGFTAVDLRTGKTLWTNNVANYGGGSPQHSALTDQWGVTILACGQLLDFVTPNQYGVSTYLWSNGNPVGVNTQPGSVTWNMFNAFDGNYILSIVNGTKMTLTEDEHGNLIGYYINSSKANEYNARTVNMWNSTLAIMNYSLRHGGSINTDYTNVWQWRPIMYAQIPFSYGLQWSMPVAMDYNGNSLPANLGISAINSGVILMVAPTANNGGGSSGNALGGYYQTGWEIDAGYNANTGEQLWITNRTYTPYTNLQGPTSFMTGDGVYVIVNQATYEAMGFSLNNGKELWTTNLPDPNTYDSLSFSGDEANGVLYLFGLGGDVYALDMQTGKVLWHYNTGTAGYDSPYGVWPIPDQRNSHAGAGDVLYFGEGHLYSPPMFRGAHLTAINITNGKPIWSCLGFNVGNNFAIADGVLIVVNDYDNQIYGYGKGPSATTASAPDTVQPLGNQVLVQGTVIDISAGSQQEAVAANFPNGLPCVSDQSMSDWMAYVYEQQPKPANATGVKVTISVLDPNNNAYDVGTTTSDASGFYSAVFTPPVPGKYTIIATFAGSEGYYGSSAETALTVSEAPAATPAPTSPPASMADLYLLPGIVGIIIAIAVVGAIIILMLRKR
jgi:outer membrane protein assembly factor BamB